MTNEEAKDYIRAWCPYDRKEEIIKALSNSDKDCISRAKAQKHIYTRLYESALNNVGYECKASDVFTDIAENRLSTWISEIPSIQPKPKTGHWIAHQEGRWIYAQCSECGEIHNTASNYCPSCGCLMDRNDFNAYIKAESEDT